MIPLAHAGGWDEIMFLLLPGVIFFFVLQLRRRHIAPQDEAEGEQTEDVSGR